MIIRISSRDSFADLPPSILMKKREERNKRLEGKSYSNVDWAVEDLNRQSVEGWDLEAMYSDASGVVVTEWIRYGKIGTPIKEFDKKGNEAVKLSLDEGFSLNIPADKLASARFFFFPEKRILRISLRYQ